MQYPKGFLVAIGGAEDKGNGKEDKENSFDFLRNGILKSVVDLLGGEHKSIEIITTATSFPQESYNHYKHVFSELGCLSVSHLNIRGREAAATKKSSDAWRNAVASCSLAVTRHGSLLFWAIPLFANCSKNATVKITWWLPAPLPAQQR